jgi:tripartite-type tricarboxylate transporter receptor subunit TctC
MIDRRRLAAASAASLAVASTGLMPKASKGGQAGGGQTGGGRFGAKAAHLLVGVPPGSGGDVVARLLAHQMTDYAAALVVENRPGASERIALDVLKNSLADGSVFMLAGSSPIAVLPHVYKRLRYDPSRDFIPVTTVCTFSFMLAVGPLVPPGVKTLDDFIRWCRANPGLATYGSLGAGTPHHFLGVTLAREAGFEFTQIPYPGSTAVQDLLTGQIASILFPVGSTITYVQSGELRGLVVTAPQRHPLLPQIPTVRESGYPALELLDWAGVFVPAKTPADAVDRLNAAIREALKSCEVSNGLEKLGLDPAGCSPAAFAELIGMDTERWGPIVEASGFRLEE